LPAVYSEDPAGQQFLDQFLSIFDHFWEGFDRLLTNIASWFDPAAAQEPDFLGWLASWMGLALDRHWPADKRRRLLENAYRLYALRGTPEGLRLHLRLYAGSAPGILEHFKLRRLLLLGSSRLAASSALFGADLINRIQLDEHAQVGETQIIDTSDALRDPFWATAHLFSIFVAMPGAGALERQTVERIVEMAKPAHTEAKVYVTDPRFRVGVQSFIGVDTVIGRYPEGVFEGQGKLGVDTVLNAGAEKCPPRMRIGKTSRLGSGTVMN
jgi:phage tail-like protein